MRSLAKAVYDEYIGEAIHQQAQKTNGSSLLREMEGDGSDDVGISLQQYSEQDIDGNVDRMVDFRTAWGSIFPIPREGPSTGRGIMSHLRGKLFENTPLVFDAMSTILLQRKG